MKASKIIGTILVAGMVSACSYTGEKYSVYFDSGSTQLSPEGKKALMNAAKMAKKEDKKIKLSGYTDATGSKEMNKKISEKRLISVKKQLERMGVKPMKISSSVKGEGLFDTKGKSNPKERRVEISVY